MVLPLVSLHAYYYCDALPDTTWQRLDKAHGSPATAQDDDARPSFQTRERLDIVLDITYGTKGILVILLNELVLKNIKY